MSFTKLGDQFNLSWGGYPPGMSKEDFKIWSVHKLSIKDDLLDVYYNVYVGPGIDPGDTVDPLYRDFWIGKTQLRIDVLLVYPDRLRILELRHAAGPSVCGSMLAYKNSLEKDDPFKRHIEMEVITDVFSITVQELCQTLGIYYTTVTI